MFLKRATLFFLLLCAGVCHAQKEKDSLLLDTAVWDYDEIFSELDALLDSLTTPRNFSLINISVGNSYFTYVGGDGTTQTKRQFTYSPSVGFFAKGGLGLSAATTLVDNGRSFSPYQYSVTGSYDYLKVRKIITGLSYTRFFTKKDLPFYTSPLQNEVYGYFTMRKLWFKPSVAASYGWGSREGKQEQETQIENILLARKGYTRVNTREQVADFNLTASVRHDFYFLDLLFNRDYLRITPQLSFTSGTQQFGFNQTASTYAVQRVTGRNVLYNTQDVSFDNNLYFQPLSLTAYVKTEYSRGKLSLQPQVLFDYYFPATKKALTTSFLLNASLLF
ncbi:hypothetical protein [Flavisolibacter nicotianae]|uniref:hypothetical protein n=1 Tax=Flavisolibacter nicotianae TaxID=2364882 RepID=UPI000EAE453D|nr:hypothetical protein [Flavisolibacter nicotianae]